MRRCPTGGQITAIIHALCCSSDPDRTPFLAASQYLDDILQMLTYMAATDEDVYLDVCHAVV